MPGRKSESDRARCCISTTKDKSMKAISTDLKPSRSTYALLVQSEEKQRSRLETLIYSALVASTLFAVSQFGQQAMNIPSNLARGSSTAPAPAQQRA